jgi:hypothetical protein
MYTKNGVELYEFPTNEKVKTSPFVSFQDREPILSGSISDLGSFLNEKYLQTPLKEKIKGRW